MFAVMTLLMHAFTLCHRDATGIEKLTQSTDSTYVYATLGSELALEPVVMVAYYTDY